jgi:hypothetical protein
MEHGDHESAERPTPEHEDAILTRISRRIKGARTHKPRRREKGDYFVSDTEDFWDRHLADLVNDTLGLGIARSEGLAPFGELMSKAFGTTRFLLAGYVQLGGHVNNLALNDWMPTSPRMSPKIHALVQLHARSLVLIEEIFVLTTMGYPSGASALARTLHEVRVIAAFLHRFEARLSERYLASHIVELWKHRADFAPGGAARRSRTWRATERELDERYREVIAKFGDSMTIENGWALPRFTGGRNKGVANSLPPAVHSAIALAFVDLRRPPPVYDLDSRAQVGAEHSDKGIAGPCRVDHGCCRWWSGDMLGQGRRENYSTLRA